MNVEKTLEQLDALLAQHRTNEIEDFLLEKIQESVSQGDTGSLITLMNELIGYYRENGEFEKALVYCKQVLQVAVEAGLSGTIPYATTLLNVANSCRAAGLLREAMMYDEKVREIYVNNIEDTDFRYVNLYHTWGCFFRRWEIMRVPATVWNGPYPLRRCILKQEWKLRLFIRAWQPVS